MGKIEIRFWDNDKQEYDKYGEYYLVNDEMEVYTNETGGYTPYLMFHKNIEPHFYLNGERIA